MTYLDPQTAKKLVPLSKHVADKFSESDWTKLGFETGLPHLITGHGRLLRSLSWGDPDYEGNCLSVLGELVGNDPANVRVIEDYLDKNFGVGGPNISTALGSGASVRFTPSVFRVPDEPQDPRLIAVMMPFTGFDAVYAAIKKGCQNTHHFYAQRADDIWKDTTVIQDVFGLIFRSHAVVCDYTGRNPNVFYEAGIAHALGKTVIPITQSKTDVPSDLIHHRYLDYLNNTEGLMNLEARLTERLKSLDPFLSVLG